MSQLHVKADNGERLTLKRSFPNDLIGTVQKTFKTLSLIVKPLAIDLQLAYQMSDAGYLVPEPIPKFPKWHIRQTQNPADVSIKTRYVHKPEIKLVPVLTPDRLHQWLQQAMTQEPPNSSYKIAISTMSAFYTRVRLYSFTEATRYVDLLDGKREVRLRISKESEGMWIYSSTENQLLYSPIFFEFGSYDGWLWLKIFITWGGLWTNPGLTEHDMLRKALQELVEGGWIPDNIPACFELI